MEFWSLDHLDLEEPLNIEIWNQSIVEQEQIQPYRSNWQLGEIGAQQAMRFPYWLPWVPDPVGHDWHRHDAVLVVGSAYASFIIGEGCHYGMTPSEYACGSCVEFGENFFAKVIRRWQYYTWIGRVTSAVVDSCRSMALFDLCRVAFVRRTSRGDECGDKVAQSAPALFTNYVERPTPNDWLWRRVMGSEASTILALGTIAEHGILRLFARNLYDVQISDSVDPTVLFKYTSADHRWLKHANIRRTLKNRREISPPPFWNVEGQTAAGLQRTWRVAVVPHPGARGDYGTYPIEALRAAYHPGL